MDELDLIRQRVREAPISDPPAPWRALAKIAVGGITEIGFAEDIDLLLVLSGHSREIIDCLSGRVIARDTGTEHRSAWIGAHDLVARGFGPLNGKQVRLAGASGGGLPLFTRDGWVAARLPIDWPEEHLLLMAPYTSIYQPAAEFWKLATEKEPVAFGFSYSGQTLVLATADGVAVYGRE